MIPVVDIASYIYQRYKKETGHTIDEMKLHKLLYFAQRESLIQRDQPLFPESFQAWRYGPVMPEIRDLYHSGDLETIDLSASDFLPLKSILDTIFILYSSKDSWSLSALTHGESSWQKAREGVAPDAKSCTPISIEDIAQDAERIKMRRFLHKSYEQMKSSGAVYANH